MYLAKSINLLEYPHSLSYQDMTLKKPELSSIPAFASKIDVLVSPIKSWETTGSSVYPSMFFKSVSECFFMTAFISSYEVLFIKETVKSTTETLAVGTRNAIPVSFPSREGITLVTAFAAPVEAGIIFNRELLPPL